jgi:hypothetical protein
MNAPFTPTRSQQRLEELIALRRPLTPVEQDELYRALHADYMRKWRIAKAEAEELKREAEIARMDLDLCKFEPRQKNERLLARLRLEAAL